MFEIKVKNLSSNGKVTTLKGIKNEDGDIETFEPSSLVEELKNALYEETGLAVENQKLKYKGVELANNDKSLLDYGIEKEVTVMLVVSVVGGNWGAYEDPGADTGVTTFTTRKEINTRDRSLGASTNALLSTCF